MKKFIISVMTALIFLSSCSLDEKIYSYIPEEGYIEDAQSARTVLYGLYRNLCNNALYGNNLSMAYDMPTDISKADGFQLVGSRVFTCNAHDASYSVVQNTWQYLYKTIFNANDFLEKAEDAMGRLSEQDKAVVGVYMAEARVIRALMYFELVRIWKNITLITATEQSRQLSSTYVQNDPEEVYKFIEKELSEAADILPWAKADNLRTDNAYMISKASALGLLARVYTTWAGYPLLAGAPMWEKAKSTCETIINSGYHGLLEDYQALWDNSCNAKWDPTESLFEISFYSPIISSSAALNASGLIGKWNGVYNVTNTTPLVRVDARQRAVATFASKWPDKLNDRRFYLSMADFYYEGTKDKLGYVVEDKSTRFYEESGIDGIMKVYKTDVGKKVDFLRADEPSANSYSLNAFIDGLYIAKWDLMKYVTLSNQMSDGNYSNANWYILRYSDVLLMYAEAVNELEGPTQEAYDAVNMVRRRGYGLYEASEPENQPDETPEDTSDQTQETPPAETPDEGTGTDEGEGQEEVQPIVTVADLPAGLSQEEFRQAVRDERAYELCFEGNRKNDLIRWGIYAETVKETGRALIEWGGKTQFAEYYLGASYTEEGKHELQPIPQREMDLMPLYKQNPNW